MENNQVDSQSPLGYNSTQDDVNEVLIVKLDEQKPVNDTKCKHETLIPDPEDTIGDAVYHGCANPKCGRGWYIKH